MYLPGVEGDDFFVTQTPFRFIIFGVTESANGSEVLRCKSRSFYSVYNLLNDEAGVRSARSTIVIFVSAGDEVIKLNGVGIGKG